VGFGGVDTIGLGFSDGGFRGSVFLEGLMRILDVIRGEGVTFFDLVGG
jgi:hypothetical protein